MENSQQLPDDFLELCRSVTAKRLKAVIDHILQHGFIATEELKETYGYNHPPRAARDVRENGIPLETFRVTGSDGRKIAAYRFGDISKARFTRLSERTGLSKQIKEVLISRYGCKCFIYLEEVDKRELQIDHRVPFEVDGEPDLAQKTSCYFVALLTELNRGHANIAKTRNSIKDKSICLSCY
jgi:hypothetical protein